MAKLKLSENKGYSLIPEGVQTFKIMSVDDSKYEDFGKLTVKMQTADGDIHFENYSLQRPDGSWNDPALRAWSYFARTAIGNPGATEIDTQDIVGHYIMATVEHQTYTKTRGDHAGEQGVSVRLKDLKPAGGFPTAPSTPSSAYASGEAGFGDTVDDFLNA